MTLPRALPPRAVLNELLRYDPETGNLFWRVRSTKWFVTEAAQRRWNSRLAGRPALRKSIKSYAGGSLLGRTCLGHRVIWKMMTGEEPLEIDHINGDRADNRLKNLRPATRTIQSRNMPRQGNNKSGATGIAWRKKKRRWHAYIYCEGRQRHLGYFATLCDAKLARGAAERALGFHRNHGREINVR